MTITAKTCFIGCSPQIVFERATTAATVITTANIPRTVLPITTARTINTIAIKVTASLTTNTPLGVLIGAYLDRTLRPISAKPIVR